MRTIAASTVALLACTVPAQMDGSEHCRVTVAVQTQPIEAGKTLLVGVKFSLDPGWHIYWKNPGDSGAPPELEWTLPEGFKAVRTFWPTPRRIEAGGIMSYGFEGEATLLVHMTAPKGYKPGSPVPFKLGVGFLVCSDLCLPGSATVEGDLAKSSSPLDLVALRKAMPTLAPVEAIGFSAAGGTATMKFELQNVDPNQVKSAYFFAAQGSVLDHASAQQWQIEAGTLTIRAKSSKYAQAQIKRPEGVLVIELDHKTIAFEYFNDKTQERQT